MSRSLRASKLALRRRGGRSNESSDEPAAGLELLCQHALMLGLGWPRENATSGKTNSASLRAHRLAQSELRKGWFAVECIHRASQNLPFALLLLLTATILVRTSVPHSHQDCAVRRTVSAKRMRSKHARSQLVHSPEVMSSAMARPVTGDSWMPTAPWPTAM